MGWGVSHASAADFSIIRPPHVPMTKYAFGESSRITKSAAVQFEPPPRLTVSLVGAGGTVMPAAEVGR